MKNFMENQFGKILFIAVILISFLGANAAKADIGISGGGADVERDDGDPACNC